MIPRPLSVGSSGEAVHRLHALLLGPDAEPARDELVAGFFGASTRDLVLAAQRQLDLPLTGSADENLVRRLEELADRSQRYVVGRVLGPDAEPVNGLVVTALDRDLRSEQVLGATRTADDGSYLISYRLEDAQRVEAATADVFVRVGRDQTVIHEGDLDETVFNAGPLISIVVRLPVATAPELTEYERLLAAAEPLLDGVGWDDLAEDRDHSDITFLSRETGFTVAQLEHLVISQRLQLQANLPGYFFYALFAMDTMARAERWATLTPRLQIGLATDLMPLLYDIVLLPEKTVTADVKQAVATFVVPRSLSRELAEISARLSELGGEAADYARRQRQEVVTRELKALLDADVPDQLSQLLATDSFGDLAGVLTSVQTLGFVPSGERANDARTRLTLTDLLGDDPDLIDSLIAEHQITEPEQLSRLAQLDDESLAGTIRARKRMTKRAALEQATGVAQRLQHRFPTAAFSARLGRDPEPPLASQVYEVLDAHPDFDLATGNVTQLLHEHHDLDTPELAASLRAAQRVFKLAPRYQPAKALLQDGLNSAAAIQSLGRERFVDESVRAGRFSAAEAQLIFATAANTHAASILLAGQLNAAASATLLPALAQSKAVLQPVTDEFPNMKSLFSTADMAECLDCRSVHSASAYLVDVLQFLSRRLVADTTVTPPVIMKAGRDVLFARRPDLGNVDLNCINTNTPLPYIDVVCELLEEAVSPDPGVPFAGAIAAGVVSPALLAAAVAAGFDVTGEAVVSGPDLHGAVTIRDTRATVKASPDGGGWLLRATRQTIGTEAEVGAAPEYLNHAAYTTLAASKAAFTLPFDLAHQETRQYLAQAGVDRAELIRRMQVGGVPSDAEIAAEQLGLSDAQRRLVVTTDVPGQPAIWATPGSPASATLDNVDAFVTRSEITYQDLLDLLELSWIDGGQNLFVQHLDSSNDLAAKRIQNLNDAALDRLHRFLRLRRATGWTSATVNRAIVAAVVGGGTLDDACLIRIAQLIGTATELRLAVDDVLDLLEPLPLADPSGSYARTFLNQSKLGSIDSRYQPDAVAANEAADTAVPGSGIKLSATSDYLALALGLSAADTVMVIGLSGPDPVLTAQSINDSYAYSRLIKSLGTTASGLRDLFAITSATALPSLSDLAGFTRQARTLLEAGRPTAELRYLLRHEADDLARYELAATVRTSLLAGLHASYDTAKAATASPVRTGATPTENSTALRPFLAQLGLADATLATLQALLDDAWADPAVTESAFVDNTFGGLFNTTAIKAALLARAAAPVPKDAAQNATLAAIGDAVSDYLYRQARDAALLTAVGATFATDEDLTTAVLHHALLKEPAAAGNPTLYDVLLNDSTTPATADVQQRAADLLAVIIKASKPATARTISWLLDNAAALGWLEYDRLPYRAGQPVTSHGAWRQLQRFLAWLDLYPDVADPARPEVAVTATAFFDAILAAQPISDALVVLAKLTGTDQVLLADLDTHLGLSAPNLSRYRDPATADGLLSTAAILRTVGLSTAQATSLTGPMLTLADAATMRSALKSRYADQEWFGVLKQIQDGLRTGKRDALVAYLLANNPKLKDSNDLYDYFLIDVEMGACMPTSRIVQAHATVQLFVMRCLMGLEPTSVASIATDDGWKQWDWMANFRVWEANRKIFLWPENWISPELRDDKSELFTALDNTLQQDELTDLAVESAAGGYLESLDDIAHLQVMAAYYQTSTKVMHVFARTKGGSPALYFHREFQQERYWTPWARVPIDITGEHLLAFDRNSRLTLAWPIFSEEPDSEKAPPNTPDPSSLSGGKSNDNPDKRWKIQLAVSELAGGRWRDKRVSAGALYTDFSQSLPPASSFNFFAWGLGASQAISCISGHGYVGSFALTGCKGYPEPQQGGGINGWLFPRFRDSELRAGRFAELNKDADDDLAMMLFPGQSPLEILAKTPGNFEVSYPLQMTMIDWILVLVQAWAAKFGTISFRASDSRRIAIPLGTLLPYFFGDYNRCYVVVPGFYPRARRRQRTVPKTRKTVSDVLTFLEDAIALLTKYLHLYQQNPGMSLADLIDKLKQDPDYLRLSEELTVYRSLRYGLEFRNFYHPLVCRFRSTLNQSGIPALMARDLQLADTGFDFRDVYQPSGLVIKPYPREDVDFNLDGAYSAYNWELFFHLPFDIAKRLNADQRFAAARDWYHYIFNPVGASDAPAPAKYWNTKPFFQRTPQQYLDQRINDILLAVTADPSGASITELAFAVEQWRSKPFKPDVVARSRPVAYQMAIVINYVQNLVDWGDHLFRQFTRESVTQATQLYVLADKLLGRKPRVVPPAVPVPDRSYHQLEAEVDLFGNALLDLESLVPDLLILPQHGAELPPPPATLSMLYFCIPPNEKLLELWDLVDDRLFKIRHCQNIDGIEAALALFAPPIDPGALVRAAAAGLDVSAVVAGLGAPLPHYRFSVMSAKATELAQQVAGLGIELLSALEKKDAEGMARLHGDQEIAVLAAIREVKQATIAEAHASMAALKKNRDVINERISYYQDQDYMNAWEITSVVLNGVSLIGEVAVALCNVLGGGAKLVPQFTAGGAGFGGSPLVTVTTGGESVGGAADSAAQVLSALTRIADKGAAMASTQGGYRRRQDEWDFQVRLAQQELAQLEKQIATAAVRIHMLDKDLVSHDRQATNAQQSRAFMQSKYTNQELYSWMAGQVSSIYYQAYKAAFDLAKQAERCYGYELASPATYLKFGYWDSSKRGLMAAGALLHDIKRMEVGYFKEDKREYELVKHVSLAELDPGALLQLKTTGAVTFRVPEASFDRDHPRHYFRRIKTVGMTLVCNAGPYTTVGATLSLVNNRYRKSTAAKQGAATDKDKYAEDLGNDDRFAYNVGSMASIATSTAVSDSGLFELNFHDERYLPFEGAGAISSWRVELPSAVRQFDYDSISDLVLHIRYTAREGGSGFKTMVEKALLAMMNDTLLVAGRTGLYLTFTLRDSFPDEWWQLKQTSSTTLTIGKEQLPQFARDHSPVLSSLTWAAQVAGKPASYPITVDGAPATLNRDPVMTTLCLGSAGAPVLEMPVTLAANPANLQELTLLVKYTIS